MSGFRPALLTQVQGPQRDGSSATGNPLSWKKSELLCSGCEVRGLVVLLEHRKQLKLPTTPRVVLFLSRMFS